MGDDSLKIVIEASLDEAKSLQNILTDLKNLQEKIKTYRLKVQAGLDQSASAAQIKSGLAQISKTKNKMKIVGEVDIAATRKNVDAAQKQLPAMTATAKVGVDGGNEIDQLRSQLDSAGTSATGMISKIYLARSALQLLRRTAVEAKETIVELDAAATDLALATGSNADEAYRLLEQYNALGKRLGATTSQVSEGATEWLRQGKNAAETGTLIEQSMILSKVGAMSADSATKNLTSTMKGFKLEANDVAGVVDKLTALDLKAAVTADDLATAVARTANSADLAGVGLDKLLGYITVVEETTQKSSETIGESFKTIFARMGNVKLGKFMDDDGEDLSDTEKVLGKFGIALRENNDQFRDFGSVLDEIASKWSGFTNVEQSAIATTIAGTRQRENFLVLMSNYGKALEYAGVAADSAGTAISKFSVYTDSIEAKSASFIAAMEGLTMNTFDSDFTKDLIDGATAVAEFADAAGLLRATLLSLGTGATLKGVQLIGTGLKTISQHVLNMGEASNILRRVGDASALSGEQIQRLGTLTMGLSDSQLKLILSSQNLSAAQMQAILQASGLTSAEAAQKIQTLGLAGAQETTAGATLILSSAMQGLKIALLANPIGTVMASVSVATVVFSLFSGAVDDAKQRVAEARDAMNNAADAANTERDALTDLINEYRELAGAEDFDASARDTAKRIQQEITDLVGEQAGNLNLVNGQLDEEIGKLNQIRVQNAIENRGALDTKYRNATSEYNAGINADGSGTNFLGAVVDEGSINQILTSIGDIKDAWKDVNGQINIGYALAGKNAEEVLAMYKELQHTLLNNDNWQSSVDDPLTGMLGVSSNDILNNVQKQIDFYNEIVENYQTSQRNFIKNEAVIDLGETLKSTNIDTQDAFDSYIEGIKSSTEYSDLYKEVLLDLANNTFPQFSGAVKNATDSGLSGTGEYAAELSDLSDTISGMKSVYDLLETAQEEMNSTGGLSADTIAKIASSCDNYMDYLYEENGLIKLNTEAWKENAEAKIKSDMEAIQREIESLNEQNRLLQEQMAGTDSSTLHGQAERDSYATQMRENSARIQELNCQYRVYEGTLNAVSSAMSEVASSFATMFGSASTLEGNIDALSKAMAELQDNGNVSASTLASLEKAMGNLDGFENVINALAGTGATVGEAQAACNAFAAELVNTSGILDQVTESNAGVIASLLESIGVMNSQELVQERLNVSKYEGVVANASFSDSSEKGAEALLKEAGASETTIASLQRLKVEQYNAALAAQDLISASTSTISALLAQAQAAGVAASSISALNKALQLKESYESGGLKGMTGSEYRELLETYAKQAQADVSSLGEITLPKIAIPYSGGSSGGSSGRSSGGSSGSSSAEAKSLIGDISDVESNVNSLSNALKELRDSGTVTASSLESLEKSMGKFGSFQRVANAMTSSGATMEEAQAACNALATEMIETSGILDQVTDENAEMVEGLLRNIGVTNAAQVVQRKYNTTELQAKVAAAGLADAEWGKVEAFLETTNATQGEVEALQALRAEQYNAALAATDFATANASVTDELIRQAKAAGASSDALAALRKLQTYQTMGYAGAKANGFQGTEEAFNHFLNTLAEQARIDLSDVEIAAPDVEVNVTVEGEESSQFKVSDGTSLADRQKQLAKDMGIEAPTLAIEEDLERYVVEIEKFRDAIHQLTEAIKDQTRTQQDLDMTDDLREKIELERKLIQDTKNVQADRHALNTERRAELNKSIAALKELGFDIDHDLENNKLYVKNLDMINKLSLPEINRILSATGGTPVTNSSIQRIEAENNRIKETEDLIDKLEKKLQDFRDQFGDKDGNIDPSSGAYEPYMEVMRELSNAKYDLLGSENNISWSEATSEYVKAENSLREFIEKTIDDMNEFNDANQENSEAWLDDAKTIREAQKSIIDLLGEIVSESSKSVDKIQDVYSTLKQGAKEFAEYEGSLTIDTFQKIVDLGPQYMQYLVEENGQWVINEERIKAVTAAKAEQLALDNAWAYVERLKLALQEDSIENLDELLYATTDAANGTWDLVYANLAMLDLDGEQYEAALHNIQVMRDLAYAAIDGIGIVSDTTSDSVGNMREGLDDILHYVMDMLKQKVQDQIDALGDMKDAYSELIDEKKKSLDATKTEESYGKKRAKQLKEIAKLQARIDMLSLDDSREAQAERTKLLEQMADLQENLSDTQSDYAIDNQKDALDKMKDAYDEEKDAEIKKLEDSVSSQQKLYEKAIDYIQAYWGDRWDELKVELLEWNYDVGSDLEENLVSAWENATAAAQKYGDFVSAMEAVKVSESSGDYGNVVANRTEHGGNLEVGNSEVNSYMAEKVGEMKRNSADWMKLNQSNDPNKGDKMRAKDARNAEIAADLSAKYGSLLGGSLWRGSDGVWYLPDGRRLYDTSMFVYHKGGTVGNTGTLQDNEVLAKLQTGETVLTRKMWENAVELVGRMTEMTEAMSGVGIRNDWLSGSILRDMDGIRPNTVTNITNDTRPVEITFGDTIINGAAPDAVERHRAINREMMNEIARRIRKP